MNITFDDKLAHYQKFLEMKGYIAANLEVVLRERKDAIHVFENNWDLPIPAEFKDFIPFGNPPPFMSGFGIHNGTAFGSVFKSQDTAINLQIAGKTEDQPINPIEIMHIIDEVLGKLLIETRDEVDALELNIEERPLHYNIEFVNHISNLDGIIYSFLAKRKIVLVGDVFKAIELMLVLLHLLPAQLRHLYGYTINIPYIDHQSIVMAVISDNKHYELEAEVNKFLDQGFELVNLETKEAFTEFTCGYSQNIAQSLLETNSLDAAQEIVRNILTYVEDVQSGETSMELAERININYDDADLLIDMKRLGEVL